MRMWLVDPEVMCDTHLKREHHEIHQFVSMLRGKWDITDAAMIEKAISHTMMGQMFPQLIEERHDELAREIVARGDDHVSRIDVPEIVSNLPKPSVTTNLIDHNRYTLVHGRKDCDACRRRVARLRPNRRFVDSRPSAWRDERLVDYSDGFGEKSTSKSLRTET